MRRRLGRWALQALASSGFAALFAWQIVDDRPDSWVGLLTCLAGIFVPIDQMGRMASGLIKRFGVSEGPPTDSGKG